MMKRNPLTPTLSPQGRGEGARFSLLSLSSRAGYHFFCDLLSVCQNFWRRFQCLD